MKRTNEHGDESEVAATVARGPGGGGVRREEGRVIYMWGEENSSMIQKTNRSKKIRSPNMSLAYFATMSLVEVVSITVTFARRSLATTGFVVPY